MTLARRVGSCGGVDNCRNIAYCCILWLLLLLAAGEGPKNRMIEHSIVLLLENSGNSERANVVNKDRGVQYIYIFFFFGVLLGGSCVSLCVFCVYAGLKISARFAAEKKGER